MSLSEQNSRLEHLLPVYAAQCINRKREPNPNRARVHPAHILFRGIYAEHVSAEGAFHAADYAGFILHAKTLAQQHYDNNQMTFFPNNVQRVTELWGDSRVEHCESHRDMACYHSQHPIRDIILHIFDVEGGKNQSLSASIF